MTRADEYHFDDNMVQEMISKCERKECNRYSSVFREKAKAARSSGDSNTANTLGLFADVTSMMLEPGQEDGPFRLLGERGGRRTFMLDDLNENQLSFLSRIVTKISDDELRARIADALWIKKSDHQMAKLAIESYLASATVVEDPQHWNACAKRIERAADVAAVRGKKSECMDSVVSHIESVLDKYDGKDPMFLSGKLMEILLKHKKGDLAKYSALSEKIAAEADVQGGFYKARQFWEVLAKQKHLANDKKGKREAGIRYAETFVREAEKHANAEKPGYMQASHFIGQAIAAYRKLEGGLGLEKQRVDELHAKLLEYQGKSTSEMGTVSTTIDLSEEVKAAVERIKGKTLTEAINALVMMDLVPKIEDLRSQVTESAQAAPLTHIIGGTIVNEAGKVIANTPGMLSDDPDESEAAMLANMNKTADYHFFTAVNGIIEPSRKQLVGEHNLDKLDFLNYLKNNSLIATKRERIWNKALMAGLKGDLMEAIHLLMPQFEHTIRYLLFQSGVITSNIDKDGIQQEYDLNRTLRMPEVEAMFGKDLTFTLRCLLVEKTGSNLRNKMAHGLMNQEEYDSPSCAFLWWLLLHLCCVEKAAEKKKED